MYDVIIIGGGPAGLTAAIYLKRAGKKVAVVEKERLGGQVSALMNISNYLGFSNISGIDLAEKFYEHALSAGVEFIFDTVKSIDITGTHKKVRTSKTLLANNLILATGIPPKKLGVQGEDKLYQKGVSYCALCDGNLYKNQDVAVITSSPQGISNALYLSGICHKVYVISQKNAITCKPDIAKRLEQLTKDGKVERVYGAIVKSLDGLDRLESVTLTDGRVIKVNGAFIYNGYERDFSLFKDKVKVSMSGIVVNKNMCTSVDGVYAVGDVRSGAIKQIMCACSDGVTAAYHIMSK